MTRRKTHEEFVKQVYELVKNEYEVIGQYVKSQDKVEMRHNVCNKEYKVLPFSFLTGNRCPFCSKRAKKKHTKFLAEVYDLVGDEYEVLGKYINNSTNIRMKHNICGHEWKVRPTNFTKHQSRCPLCFRKNMKDRVGRKAKTHEEFVKEVYDLVGDEYTILSRYTLSREKLKIKHNLCGHEYEVRPLHFVIKENRCPLCTVSKGEGIIKKWLEANEIKYKIQFRIEECRHKNSLAFDFAVMNDVDAIMLIEFDGIQHFKAIDYFGGEEIFNYTKLLDNIKNQYCQDNNIPLLRIPYWELDNIEEILKKILI